MNNYVYKQLHCYCIVDMDESFLQLLTVDILQNKIIYQLKQDNEND